MVGERRVTFILIFAFIAYFPTSFSFKCSNSALFSKCSLCNRYACTSLKLIDNDNLNILAPNSLEDEIKPVFKLRDYEKERQEEEERQRQKSSSFSSSFSEATTTSQRSPFGGLSEKLLKGYDTGKKFSNKPIPKEDLNGINPVIPIVFSSVPAGMSYTGWQLSSYLASHFAIQFIDPEVNPYPVVRAATIARNLVVGLTTLATGFSGVVSVGLFVMGCVVAVGVLKGELDPNKESESNKKK